MLRRAGSPKRVSWNDDAKISEDADARPAATNGCSERVALSTTPTVFEVHDEEGGPPRGSRRDAAPPTFNVNVEEERVRCREEVLELLTASGVKFESAWPPKQLEALVEELAWKESRLEMRRNRRICRVRHFLQAQVYSQQSEPQGFFLFKKWEQRKGTARHERNELVTIALRADEVPIDDVLDDVCSRALASTFQSIEDWHFQAQMASSLTSDVVLEDCRLVGSHSEEVRPSLTHPGIFDESHYHLVNVLCSGVPNESFAAVRFERDLPGSIADVTGWCWLSLPKALGEHWRCINIQEGRSFAAARPERELRASLRALADELSTGRSILERAPSVKGRDLEEVLQHALAVARRAQAEYASVLAASLSSSYSHPRVQSFVRTTARRTTACVDDDLWLSEMQIRRGDAGRKSFIRTEGRRLTAPIEADLHFDFCTPNLRSEEQWMSDEEDGELADLSGIRDDMDPLEELSLLAEQLGRQEEERACTSCPLGHQLESASVKLFALCDICKVVLLSEHSVWRCASCNWTRCQACSDEKVAEIVALLRDEADGEANSQQGDIRSDSTARILQIHLSGTFGDALPGLAEVLAGEFQNLLFDVEDPGRLVAKSEASMLSEEWDGDVGSSGCFVSSLELMPLSSLSDGGIRSSSSMGDSQAERQQRLRVATFDSSAAASDDSELTEAAKQQRMSMVS